jgi:hypothetical protein
MAIPSLKPSDELVIGVTSVAIVLAIFNNDTPNVADIRADKPNNVNTHKATKMAALTATAVVGSVALLGKSPTVFTIGGAMILFEVWKRHYANYGANGTHENMQAASY